MPEQSNLYQTVEQVERVHDMPGADIERNLMRVRIISQEEGLGVTVENPLRIENPNGDEIEIATETTLGSIEEILGNDLTTADGLSLKVTQTGDPATEPTLSSLEGTISDSYSTNGDGGLKVVQASPFSVESQSPLETIAADGEVFDGYDRYEHPLNANDMQEDFLIAKGCQTLKGRIVSDNAYSVYLNWYGEDGNVIFNDEIVSNEAGGTATNIEEATISPAVGVVITEESGISSIMNATFHLS